MEIENRLLASLSPDDRAMIVPALSDASFDTGNVLFETGDDVSDICFPGRDMIGSLVLRLREGASAEAAMIGFEGAIGGIISEGNKPAFANAIVQVGGRGLLMPAEALQKAREQSPTFRDHFARYADCLLAQVMQSVACNAVHELDARLARWLLTMQDRLGSARLQVTQEFAAQMLGVQRPYATRILGDLERRGSIATTRGAIIVVDRAELERQACECYAYLRRHFERVLPGIYPSRAD